MCLSALDGDQVDLLALDEALRKLEAEQPSKAQLVKLRYFAGCTLEETAQILGFHVRPPNAIGHTHGPGCSDS